MKSGKAGTKRATSRGWRVAKWASIGLFGTAALGSAIIFYQASRPPAKNAYYVALGSSFAAGLGLGDRAPGSPIISGRSKNGYPQQLARSLQVPSFTDMSSSGSTILHVLHGGQFGMGPQIDALGPDTRLVTLTGGGNDVSYIGDLDAMARIRRGGVTGSIATMLWKGAKPIDERQFSALRANMASTLSEIRRRSPQARIIVVTYPEILPSVAKCEALGITPEQAELMRGVARELAVATRAAVAETGATLVDMATLSLGHDACSSVPWVNGAAPQSGAAFHPTLAGARATAGAIVDALGGMPMSARLSQ